VRGKIYASKFAATTLYCAVVAFQRARTCLNELQNARILSRPIKGRRALLCPDPRIVIGEIQNLVVADQLHDFGHGGIVAA
jgi:hypothetical protein